MSLVDHAPPRTAHPADRVDGAGRDQPAELHAATLFDATPLEPRLLLDRLADIEQRERTLIAEAIHDDPLQLIVAAITQLDLLGADHPDAAPGCAAVNSMLDSAVDTLRALIVSSSAPTFEGGLATALGRLATGVLVGTDTAVRLTGAMHVSLTAEANLVAYRIVREALVNARKHAFAQHVSIDLRETDHAVVITVQDDGVGCEPPQLGQDGGHLGLTVMHSRARAAGGRVRVSSARGAGTTVVLTLPRNDSRTLRPHGVRVFLVDDHAAARQDLADLMDDELDMTVVGQASSIADALEQIPAHRPDVLITDVRLRDGNGADLYARIRSALPHLRCLMLTDCTDGDLATAAIRAGAGGYLIKDSDPADVIAAVRTVAGGRSVLDAQITTMLVDRLRA
jgi:CheY-like chemotaxis protein/anti-sigma regulatory factor (Ser/Thr protein kinase)